MNYDCLIIDDEKMLADSTAEYLNLFGITTFAVYSSAQCLDFLENNKVQLLLLDINLGDGSGLLLCRQLRLTMDIPILFISARTTDDDKIAALSIGGDDYIEKPYSLGFLLAKVKVVLKRYGQTHSDNYSDQRLVVDLTKKQLTVNGEPVRLKALEFKLLAYLIENKDRVVGKQELFENVWKDKFTGDGTLNVHIRRIRKAIEADADHPSYILTVWGEGYRFQGSTS